MIELLFGLLLLAVFVYAVVLIIGMIPFPDPRLKQIVYLIVALILLALLLDRLGLYSFPR